MARRGEGCERLRDYKDGKLAEEGRARRNGGHRLHSKNGMRAARLPLDVWRSFRSTLVDLPR